MIESIKDQGENLSQESREFAVDRKTLRTWMGNYENMKAIVKKRSWRRLDGGGGRPSKLPELQLELFRSFKCQERGADDRHLQADQRKGHPAQM